MTFLFSQNFPRWARIVAVLLLLWSLMGVWAFYRDFTMTPEVMSKLPQAQQDIWKMMPKWHWANYALSVGAGVLAPLLMNLRNKWADPVALLTLAFVVVQFGYVLLATPILKTIGASAAVLPVAIMAIAAVQWGLARDWFRKGWLS